MEWDEQLLGLAKQPQLLEGLKDFCKRTKWNNFFLGKQRQPRVLQWLPCMALGTASKAGGGHVSFRVEDESAKSKPSYDRSARDLLESPKSHVCNDLQPQAIARSHRTLKPARSVAMYVVTKRREKKRDGC